MTASRARRIDQLVVQAFVALPEDHPATHWLRRIADELEFSNRAARERAEQRAIAKFLNEKYNGPRPRLRLIRGVLS